MSSIGSKVEAVEQLFFRPIPSKPINVERVVRVGNTTTFVDTAGNVYSTGVDKNCHYAIGRNSTALSNTLAGCIKLGLLTKEAVKKHEEYNALVHAKRLRKYSANALRINAFELGLKLTKAQEARITKATQE